MLPPSSQPLSDSVMTPTFDRLGEQDLLRLAAVLLFVVGLSYFTGAFSVGPEVPISSLVRPTLVPRAASQIVSYGVWIGSGLFLLVHWRSVVMLIMQTGLVWVFQALVLGSAVWSIQPDYVNLMNRELWQMICFSLFVAIRFSFVQQLRLTTLTLGLGALGSGVLTLVVPAIGRHTIDHVGAWKGLYDYKNTLGSLMIIGLVAFLLTATATPIARGYRWIGMGLCGVMILGSTSKTALLLAVFSLLLVKFFQRYRWRGNLSIVLSSLLLPVMACTGFAIANYWVWLAAGLGKDPTMSGRTGIWQAVLHYIQERPFFGFGRSAFWAQGSIYAIRAGERVGARYVPPHAHNGFLDLLLDVGFVGLGLFLVVFVWVYGQALWLAYNAQQIEDYWPVSYLSFLAMNNMTESFLLRLANAYWVLFLMVALSLPGLIRQRQQARAGPGTADWVARRFATAETPSTS
jgi:exopolysaccharide production protein ExoQ